MATFSDLMNLLLCFFVLLFSMSTVDEVKQEKVVASFNQMFSVFEGGAQAIGDGMLISNGVSQLNELDEFINSTGKMDDGEIISEDVADGAAAAKEQLEEAQMEESETLAEKIQEAVDERDMADEVEIQFTAQFVQLTLKGSLLFDSGSTLLKDEAKTVNKYMIVVWAGTDWSPKSREITRAVEHLAKNSPEPVLWCIQDEREEMTEEEQKLPSPGGNLEHPRPSGGLPHRKHGIPVGRRLQGNIASRHETGNGSRKTAKQGQCPVGKSRRFIRNGRGPSLRRRASAASSLCGLCQKGYSGKNQKGGSGRHQGSALQIHVQASALHRKSAENGE